ncbi:hypothetical protein, partial [Raoultella terrigena]|uniref:hypothetical protein n=1 Tax=Raoultella terrigena TaxID=577 RepID=UPI001C700C42
LWIVGLLPAVRAELAGIAIHFGKSQVTALTLIEGSLSATVVMLLALWLSSTLERRLLDRTIVDLSMRKVAANATRAGLLLVGLLFALSAVGVDLTALLAAARRLPALIGHDIPGQLAKAGRRLDLHPDR